LPGISFILFIVSLSLSHDIVTTLYDVCRIFYSVAFALYESTSGLVYSSALSLSARSASYLLAWVALIFSVVQVFFVRSADGRKPRLFQRKTGMSERLKRGMKMRVAVFFFFFDASIRADCGGCPAGRK
jgi:hypothetical protein